MENNGLSDNGGGRARILIVGAGFAGFAGVLPEALRVGAGRSFLAAMLLAPYYAGETG